MNELAPYIIQRTVAPSGNAARTLAPPAVELGSYVEDHEGNALHDFWCVIRERIWVVLGFLFGAVLTTALVVWTMEPIFTATTTILIEPRTPRVVEIPQVLSEPLRPDEDEYYKTQYEIMKSRSLAAQVIQAENLEQNDAFTGKGRERGFILTLWSDATTWLNALVSQFLPPSAPPDAGNRPAVNPGAISTYIGEMLEVKPIKGTRLVNVAFNTPDPELSARLANAHAEAYIRQGVGLRSKASQEAQKFLEEKLVELQERVEESEGALNSYRRDKGILSLDDKENIVVERLADLNKRLTEAEADRIGLEAHVRLIRMRDYDALPAVINSALIQTLKGRLVQLEGEYANLSTQFKLGYPKLAQLKAQLQETQLRLQQEIQKVVGGIESSYMAAAAKEKDLRAKMEDQKAATLSLKDASVGYAILAREVNTNRQLYDSVLERMKEIGVAAELRTSNVFVIDVAETPREPSKPQKRVALLFSALLGLMGGVGLAFLLKYLDNTFHTAEDAERYLALPNLGLVPDYLSFNRGLLERAPAIGRRALQKRDGGPSAAEVVFYPSDPAEKPVLPFQPVGVVNEAYRTLRTGILLSEMEEPPRTVLFTSAVHGEGKTATVVNSAITFAQMGVKVLLVDADLRHPMCHRILGMRRGLGVGELLTEMIKPTWAVQPTHIDNLFFISSGSSGLNPTELVGSRKMRECLLWARQRYDYILVDSPPVMAVTDAVLLSTMVDGVVMVIGGQETPRNIVRQACSRLRYARANILGMVLNRTDPNRDAYAYDGYNEYSGATMKEA
jgi:capsular exopolysaccharide synthesis family protein